MPYRVPGRSFLRFWPLLALGLVGLVLAALVVCGARNLLVEELSSKLGQPVRVDGPITFHLGFTALRVEVERLRTDRPTWPGGEALLSVAHGEAVAPWTILVGGAHLSSLRLDGMRLSLQRDRFGHVNWGAGQRRPLNLPLIDQVYVTNSSVTVDDAERQTTFSGELSSSGSTRRATTRLQGRGTCQGDPWTLALELPPPSSKSSIPVGMRLLLSHAGASSSMSFFGTIQTGPARLVGRLSSAGANLHDLAALLKAPLFRTPPYALQAQLDATRNAVKLQGMSGWIGRSDLDGDVTITPRPSGRRLDARVHSRSLRIADLFSVVSGGRLTEKPPPGRLLPQAQIDPKPLRPLTGTILYAADSVQSPTRPAIRSLRLRATMDHGVISADPMDMALAQGRMNVRFALNVRGPVPAGRLRLALQDADIAEFRGASVAPSPVQARFDARIDLAGTGQSLSQIAATSSGRASLNSSGGEVRRLQADVLSAQFADGLSSLVGHRDAFVRLRCAVVDLRASDGRATADRIRLVTDMGVVTGSGSIDLGQQTLALALRPSAGGASPSTEVFVAGPLVKPQIKLSAPRPIQAMQRALLGVFQAQAPRVTDAGCG